MSFIGPTSNPLHSKNARPLPPPDYLSSTRVKAFLILPGISQLCALIGLLTGGVLGLSTLYSLRLALLILPLPWLYSSWLTAADPLLPQREGRLIRPYLEALLIYLLNAAVALPMLGHLLNRLARNEPETVWTFLGFCLVMILLAPWMLLNLVTIFGWLNPPVLNGLLLIGLYLIAALSLLLFATLRDPMSPPPENRSGED